MQGLINTTVQAPSNPPPPFDAALKALVPPGWDMAVWAIIDTPRLGLWLPDKSFLVSRPEHNDVLRLVPDSTDPAAAPAVQTLLSNLTLPHGMAFNGSTLWVATTDAVVKFTYSNGKASDRVVVIEGLPDEKDALKELGGHYAHVLKSILLGKRGELYVMIGSTSNISADDRKKKPERAAVHVLEPGAANMTVFTQGVRNGVGLAMGPDGHVWCAINNRDNIVYPYNQPWDGDASAYGKIIGLYVTEHPPEMIVKLQKGRDAGWPYCMADPRPNSTAYGQMPVSSALPEFFNDYETNHDGENMDCSALKRAERTFGAHSAPLGMVFAQVPGFGYGALVCAHGSWDADPPRAPEVAFFPWENGTLGAQQTLVGGFQQWDTTRWGRPVSATQGPDGAFYVTDDQAAAVYRLTPGGAIAAPAPGGASAPRSANVPGAATGAPSSSSGGGPEAAPTSGAHSVAAVAASLALVAMAAVVSF